MTQNQTQRYKRMGYNRALCVKEVHLDSVKSYQQDHLRPSLTYSVTHRPLGRVEAMSDRLCIQTNGKVSVEISAEDLLSCCDECGMGWVYEYFLHVFCVYRCTCVCVWGQGRTITCIICLVRCSGGFLSPAWRFWTTKGLVSGGLYGSKVGEYDAKHFVPRLYCPEKVNLWTH